MGERSPLAILSSQQNHLPLWIPVAFAIGIGGYFSMPTEPNVVALSALMFLGFVCAVAGVFARGAARILVLAVLIALLGFGAAVFRSNMVAAPVLAWPQTVNVEGRIVGLDRSSSGRPRITLDRVILYGTDPSRTPERVRVSLEPDTDESVLVPGARVLGQARLSPPSAPAEPGGFDFRRHAWFDRLGAVGYSRTPFVERPGQSGLGLSQALFKLRLHLSRQIQDLIPGRDGGFAAAILTGDRSGVDPEALQDLRRTNLAHLLAISGLHMGLLTGFTFAMVRIGLAFVPRIALNVSSKKIAAVVALVAGAVYLGLSGANVATQRAFIMTSVVLFAVLLDRPAFSLRSVALAAFVILAIRPESLTGAGFQMSFAASTALIVTFDRLGKQEWWRDSGSLAWRASRPVIAVAITSFVAGAATAPFSAFHFNTLSQYGLVANVLAVPAMGLLVMPAAVVAGILSIIGLGAPAFWVMGKGIAYILNVAGFMSSLEGGVRTIHAGPSLALVLIALGALFVILWIGRLRYAGVLPVFAGLFLWMSAERPDILVSENGRLFGVETGAGRVVNSEKGNSFAASIWLRNDGDGASQREAFRRPGMERTRGRAFISVPGLGGFRYVGSKNPGEEFQTACKTDAILLAPDWKSEPDGDCVFIGRNLLRREGAIAISIIEGRPVLDGAKSRNSSRPWTRDHYRSAGN